MHSEEIHTKLKGWAEQGLFLLRKLLPSMAPVSRHEHWEPAERRTLGYLLSASARSSESALLLVANGQLWDAEILVRSVTEGSIKFYYLLQQPDTFKERHDDYSRDLYRIALFKDHKKAAELLAAVPNPDDHEWKPIRDQLLSDDEFAAIGNAQTSAGRRSLEAKWGFTGLVGELARSGDNLSRGFTGFAHGYSMASHVLHADFVGTSMALDRDLRSLERRDAILLAHGTRLISDVLTCFYLRLAIGYRFISNEFGPVQAAGKEIEALRAGFGNVFEDWMRVEYPAHWYAEAAKEPWPEPGPDE
ncbi:MAG: hypothetical protein E5W81_20515 [Mesorhizobium sp.]|nr:MAG: hypothetical protein E5V36_10135 [Mesorhizobium sp.]TKB62760.1 MAG: hypothetical protein E5W81_20515 [Mesorhizobium sp.]